MNALFFIFFTFYEIFSLSYAYTLNYGFRKSISMFNKNELLYHNDATKSNNNFPINYDHLKQYSYDKQTKLNLASSSVSLTSVTSKEGIPIPKCLRNLFGKLPSFNVGRLKVNIFGIFFALQCWSLMLCWLGGMLMIMPFKLIFGKLFDSEGIIIDAGGRWWSRLTTFPHSLPRVTGIENIPSRKEPTIYVSNHQSWMDIPYMGGYLPALKFVCKKELTKIPILGPSIVWGQHIVVDRKNMAKRTEVLDQCIDRLKRGVSICLFPEGTRSSLPNGEMLPFQKGAFLIAQQTGVRMVPVSLSHTGEMMPSNYLLPRRPGLFYPRLHVHPPVETTGKTIKELMKEVREIIESEIEPPFVK